MTHEVRAALEAEFGAVHGVESVTGGCISPSYRVRLADGRSLFVKTARAGWGSDAFAEEARSLDRLRATSTVVVPEVFGAAATWLALEWLEPKPATARDWAELGAGLARLHRVRSAGYGWDASNYIGPLPQGNERTVDWPAFWAAQRLEPLVERAGPRLDSDTVRLFARLIDSLDQRLAGADEDGASLLHGDLWSGNVHMSVAGAGVIDPASYYGDREVDLAMAALFGGFPREFTDAYAAVWPLREGAAARRPIYQLYYLLVHVALFGGSYVGTTSATLRAALR